MENTNFCPVCGYDLGFKPWEGNLASDEICPSCGIQFGYDDAARGNEEARKSLYLGWRLKWVKDGYKWSTQMPQPLNWNPKEQIKNIYGII